MKTKMKIGAILLVIIFTMINNIYSQGLTSRKTNVTYTEKYGVKFIEIKTILKNNSTKNVAKVYISVVFKDKRNYSPFDLTSPTKAITAGCVISISPGLEKEAVFSIIEPSEIHWVYNYSIIERVIYSDGSAGDF